MADGNSKSFTGGSYNVNSAMIPTTITLPPSITNAATYIAGVTTGIFKGVFDTVTAGVSNFNKNADARKPQPAPTVTESLSPAKSVNLIKARQFPALQPFTFTAASPIADVSGTSLRDGKTERQSNGTAIKEFDGPADIWTRPEPPLLFPSNLTTTALKFPFIGFAARMGATGERSIYLPIPPGISFSDQMQYSTIDLGIIGKAVARATTAAVNEGGFFSGAGGAIGSAVGTLVNQARSANGAAAASLVARQTGFDNVANFIDIGARQVIAPNTNTAFQNSGVRQFQFSFKMMPKDQKEAFTITEIVKRFRQNMYPMGNDLILTYPPIWNIKFYDGAKSEENTKLPAIYDCYLTGMSAVYNSSGNMFHADGHPVETDVQLTFEETRALTLSDIVKLSENRF